MCRKKYDTNKLISKTIAQWGLWKTIYIFTDCKYQQKIKDESSIEVIHFIKILSHSSNMRVVAPKSDIKTKSVHEFSKLVRKDYVKTPKTTIISMQILFFNLHQIFLNHFYQQDVAMLLFDTFYWVFLYLTVWVCPKFQSFKKNTFN